MSTSEPTFGDKMWKTFQGKKLRPLERELLRRTLLALDTDKSKGGTPNEIAKNSTRLAFVPGETMLEEGGTGDALYILLDGAAEVVLGDKVVERLRPGEVFGEISMLTGEPRTATVRASDKTIVMRIPKEQVDATLRQRLWDYAAERRFVNLIDNPEPDLATRQTWYLQARHTVLRKGQWDTQAEWIFLYAGTILVDGETVHPPRLISGGLIEVPKGEARVAFLPPPPSTDPPLEPDPVAPLDFGRFR